MSNLIRMIFPTVAGLANDAPTKPGGEGNPISDEFGKVLDDAKQNADGMFKVPKPPNDQTGDGENDELKGSPSDVNTINPIIPKIIAEPNQKVNGPIAQDAPEQLDALNKSGIATDNSPLPVGIQNEANRMMTGNAVVPSIPAELVLAVAVNPISQPVENGAKSVSKDSGKDPNQSATDLSGDPGKADKDLTPNDPEAESSDETNLDQWTMSATMANMAVLPLSSPNLQTSSASVAGNSDIADELTVTNRMPSKPAQTLSSDEMNAQWSQSANTPVANVLEGMTSGPSAFEQSIQKALQSATSPENSTVPVAKPVNATESFDKETPSFGAAQSSPMPDLLKTAGTQSGVKESDAVREKGVASDIRNEASAVFQGVTDFLDSRKAAAIQNPTTGISLSTQQNPSERNVASSDTGSMTLSGGSINPDSGIPMNNHKTVFDDGIAATSVEKTRVAPRSSSETENNGAQVNLARTGETTNPGIAVPAHFQVETVLAGPEVASESDATIQPSVITEGENGFKQSPRPENASPFSGIESVGLNSTPVIVSEGENPVSKLTAAIPTTTVADVSKTMENNEVPQSFGAATTVREELSQTVPGDNSASRTNPLDVKSLQSIQVSGRIPVPIDAILARIKPVSLFKNASNVVKTPGEIRAADESPNGGPTLNELQSTLKTNQITIKPSVKADSASNTAGTVSAATNAMTDSTAANQNVLPLGAFQKTGKDVAMDESVSRSLLQTGGVTNAKSSPSEKVVEFIAGKLAGKTGVKDDFKSSLTAPQPAVSVQTGPEKPEVQNTGSSVAGHEDLFGQIMERAKVMISRGHSEMEVSLKPDHLGKLQLRVAIENQVVTAKFAVESQQVKEIIETNLPQLRQQLHDQGIQADALTVTVNLQNNAGDWQQPSGQQSHLNFTQPVTRGKPEMTADIPEKTVARRPVLDTLVDFIA